MELSKKELGEITLKVIEKTKFPLDENKFAKDSADEILRFVKERG